MWCWVADMAWRGGVGASWPTWTWRGEVGASWRASYVAGGHHLADGLVGGHRITCWQFHTVQLMLKVPSIQTVDMYITRITPQIVS